MDWLVRISGVVALVCIGVMVYLIVKMSPDGFRKEQYDERQTLERLKAARAGFYAMLIVALIYLIVTSFAPELGNQSRVWMCVMLFFGIGTFCLYAIFSDAFFSLRQKPWLYLLLIGVNLLTQGFNLVNYFADGGTLRDSVGTNYILVLGMILLLLIIGAALVIKMILDRTERD